MTNTSSTQAQLPVAASGTGVTGMRYSVLGTTLQVAILELDPGEKVFSEAGRLAWCSGNILMGVAGRGGIGGVLSRMVLGESAFFTEYSSTNGPGVAAFSANLPGNIVPVHLLPGQSILVQRGGFLCGERTVSLRVAFQKRLGAGLFGGEGFILQELTGPGVVFIAIDGETVEYLLGAGQVLRVDPGYLGMMDPTITYSVGLVSGVGTMLFGGEGPFLATLTGPGRVILQTTPVARLAGALYPYFPFPKQGV